MSRIISVMENLRVFEGVPEELLSGVKSHIERHFGSFYEMSGRVGVIGDDFYDLIKASVRRYVENDTSVEFRECFREEFVLRIKIKEIFEVIEQFDSLIKGEIKYTDSGICKNINIPLILSKHYPSWEHFSGSSMFPIPGGSSSYFENLMNETLWEGEQRELRIDLCKHLHKKLSKELSSIIRAFVVEQMRSGLESEELIYSFIEKFGDDELLEKMKRNNGWYRSEYDIAGNVRFRLRYYYDGDTTKKYINEVCEALKWYRVHKITTQFIEDTVGVTKTIESLNRVAGGNIEGLEDGICLEFRIPQRLLEMIFVQWDHFSGDNSYPVPGTEYECPIEQYESGGLWEGKQLEYRLDLCSFIAKKLPEVMELYVKENGK